MHEIVGIRLTLPYYESYASSCTPFTARPLGSFMFLKAASHARASAVEHATLHAWHAAGCAFTGKVLLEDAAIVVFFLVLRRIDRKPFGCVRHLLVTDGFGGKGFQCINPTIAHAVAELLFLSPCYTVGQHVCKGFADDFQWCFRGIFASGLRRMAMSRKSLSRKGTRPSTPCCEGFIGTEAVIEVELA